MKNVIQPGQKWFVSKEINVLKLDGSTAHILYGAVVEIRNIETDTVCLDIFFFKKKFSCYYRSNIPEAFVTKNVMMDMIATRNIELFNPRKQFTTDPVKVKSKQPFLLKILLDIFRT